MDDYSCYSTVNVNNTIILIDFLLSIKQRLVYNTGTMIAMPVFHHFDVNDNIILLAAYTSRLSAWLLRAFAKTSQVFYASTGAAVLGMITSAPIR